jgi:hypothetical protein
MTSGDSAFRKARDALQAVRAREIVQHPCRDRDAVRLGIGERIQLRMFPRAEMRTPGPIGDGTANERALRHAVQPHCFLQQVGGRRGGLDGPDATRGADRAGEGDAVDAVVGADVDGPLSRA